MKPITFLGFCLGITGAASTWAGNWPGWRGPEGTGVATETGLVETWSTNSNVRWRVDLPGPGNSSPVVWGSRVFVTQSIQKENRRTLMCFDRADGKLLWQSGLTYTEKEQTQAEVEVFNTLTGLKMEPAAPVPSIATTFS